MPARDCIVQWTCTAMNWGFASSTGHTNRHTPEGCCQPPSRSPPAWTEGSGYPLRLPVHSDFGLHPGTCGTRCSSATQPLLLLPINCFDILISFLFVFKMKSRSQKSGDSLLSSTICHL